MKIDNKGQISIEWLLLLSALMVILGVVIFVISNSATTQKTSTKGTVDQLNKTITDLWKYYFFYWFRFFFVFNNVRYFYFILSFFTVC